MYEREKHMLKQTLALAIIAIALTSIILPTIIPILKVEAEVVKEEDMVRLRNRALALRYMLRRALMLNISGELLAEVEFLVNVNVSSLTYAELREYVARCKEVMARVELEVRRSWAVDLGSIYAQRVRAAIESRLRIMARIYNVSLDEEISNISRTRSLEELWRELKQVERALERARARKFAEQAFRRVELVMNTTIERPEALDIKKTVSELGKVTEVLNKVAERLEKLNVSKEAVEHIRIAVEHVSMAKQILENVSINLTVVKPERTRVREIVNKTLEKLYDQVNEALNELKAEIEELTERALEVNATNALEDLEQLKQRIENLTQILQQTGISIENLKEIMITLAKIRLELREVDEEIRRSIERWMPEVPVDKAFNVTLSKARDNLNTVKEMISYLESKYKDIVCIAIYPPPPICRYLYLLPQLLNRSKEIVTTAEDMINKALEFYNSGRKVQALHLVVRANAMLVNTRAWLEPIYNMLKLAERTKEGGSDKGKDELATKLGNIVEQLKAAEEKLTKIKSRLESTRGSTRVAMERTINEIETLIRQANELVEKARNALNVGDSSSASEAIAKTEFLLKQVEAKLSVLEKLLS